ncbi:hypothetical protein Btru_051975 [Bulinus truncatus]|nr:hypothetical protein Btru_051975 [Bulinus truncatus]
MDANLFDFCHLTLCKNIQWSEELESEITCLGFKIVHVDPLKIEIDGLNFKNFYHLIDKVLKFSIFNTDSKQEELLSSGLASLSIEDNSNDLKNDLSIISPSLPYKSETLKFTEPDNINEASVSNKNSEKILNFDGDKSEPNNAQYSQLMNKYQNNTDVSENNFSEIKVKEQMSVSSYSSQETETDKAKSHVLASFNEFQHGEIKSSEKRETTELKDRQEKSLEKEKEYLLISENEMIIRDMKKEESKKKSNPRGKSVITGNKLSCSFDCSDSDSECVEGGEDVKQPMFSSTNRSKQSNTKKFQGCANRREHHQEQNHYSGSDGSDIEHSISLSVSKEDFEASKLYFEDDILYEFIKRATLNGSRYVIEVNEKGMQHTENLNILKNFKTFSVDDVSDNQARKWRKLIIEKHSKVKVVCNMGKFQIMGLKDEVLSLRSLILSLRGNNDNEMIWHKSHTDNTASGCMIDLNQDSSSKLVNSRKIEQDSKGRIYFGMSNLQITVDLADITKLDVNIIVNAANRHLHHGGGVAAAISKAAGPKLHRECEDFIKKNSGFTVTDVFVSSGGNLKAKKVMHAVGPKWESYEENEKWKCLIDLRHTVLRCLVEASRLGAQTIAFPSISAAIFKVPPESCARCYLEAVKNFDSLRQNLGLTSLLKISFVDVIHRIVNTIQDEFLSNWSSEPNHHDIDEDYKFALKHINRYVVGQEKFAAHYEGAKPKGPSGATESIGEGIKMTYLCKKLEICISDKPAFSYNNDEMIIVLGRPFEEISGLSNCKWSQIFQHDLNCTLKNVQIFRSSSSAKSPRQMICLMCDTFNKENLKNSFEYLTSLDLAHISGRKISSIVFTSKLLYSEDQQFGFKLVGNFAELLHKYILHVSEDKNMKCVRIATSTDAYPNITKVFDSRNEDMKSIAKVNKFSTEINKKTIVGRCENNNQPIERRRTGSRERDNHMSVERRRTGSRERDNHMSVERRRTGSRERDNHMSVERRRTGSRERDNHMSVERRRTGSRERDNHISVERRRTESRESDQNPVRKLLSLYPQLDSSVDVGNARQCQICLDENVCFTLHCCYNEICNSCFRKVQKCPYCRTAFGIMKGNQPNGEMLVKYLKHQHAAGYERYDAWEIEYCFKSGKQKENHPNPGKSYSSTLRKAYLPDTPEALKVLLLLKVAFMRRLTFTIGSSLTLNINDRITWNDIHHKTSLNGGSYGYPDAQYLMRVTKELKEKSVTLENLTNDEKHQLDIFEKDLKKKKKI